MIFIIWLGALLTIAGVLYLVKQIIWQGPLSGPARRRPRATLEPRTGLFGLATHWPGLALIALGGILLLAGAALLEPQVP
ncbi:hypothetical protein DFP91_2273 [Pseudorhodoplanes sinuspersici]|nr:hypothetical protein DFP91_2273 [Pseudorhodoplanes sinuspersici]